MEEKFSFFLFITTILDLYFNYYNTHFPEYRKARIFSDIFSILSVMLPIFLVLFICCMGLCIYFQLANNNIAEKCTYILTILIFLSVIVLSFCSLTMQIYSIYVYMAYDGKNKIKKPIIKLLMWISLINLFIKLFFANCNLISYVKKKKKEEVDEEAEELQNQELERI